MGLCPYPPPAVASWSPCNETFCLFNVSADPCEHKNLAEEMPEVVERMTTRLKAFQVRKKHTFEQNRHTEAKRKLLVLSDASKLPPYLRVHRLTESGRAVLLSVPRQATAVPPVRPEGCNPVIDSEDAWRPCDSPDVLEHGYNVGRTDSFHRARAGQTGYQMSGTASDGKRFASGEL